MIRFGFACKTIGVPGIVQNALILSRASEENLIRVSRQNIHALMHMLDYCRTAGISLLRISSDIIPLGSHPAISFDWKNLLHEELEAVREKLSLSGIRVSMHPGQYTILNSPREDVVERSVADLDFHAAFLTAVGAGPEARIILHLGGAYGDRESALERLTENLRLLAPFIRDRLALENDERIYTIEEVLRVCDEFALPAIFDVFHHSLNPPATGSQNYWLDRASATWNGSSGRPKIHYSQQLPGGKPGMHSQSIGMLDFLDFYRALHDRELDVMLEVKDKNISAIKCINLTTPGLPRNRLTEEWARYKYLILEHSPEEYQKIRELLKDDNPEAQAFYAHIEASLDQKASPGNARNAAQHVWGYVDRLASPRENRQVLSDMEKFEDDPAAVGRVKRKLFALAEKNGNTYLLNSLYFYF